MQRQVVCRRDDRLLLQATACRMHAHVRRCGCTDTHKPQHAPAAGSTVQRPSRSAVATSASYAFSSSIAFSALVSVITPTVAAQGENMS